MLQPSEGMLGQSAEVGCELMESLVRTRSMSAMIGIGRGSKSRK